MESINFVCLGQTGFINELGKKGQSSDITTYDKKKDNRIVTYVIPSGYPDKIQPLITAVNLAEYFIVNVNKLDRYLGEQIVALDLLQLDKGFLLHSYEVDNEKLRSLLRDTVVSSFKFEENTLRWDSPCSLLKSSKIFRSILSNLTSNLPIFYTIFMHGAY